LEERCGETWFPHTFARGRVWAGAALTQEDGETGFPHAPPGGRVWEGCALSRSMFTHQCGAGRSRMDD